MATRQTEIVINRDNRSGKDAGLSLYSTNPDDVIRKMLSAKPIKSEKLKVSKRKKKS